MAVLKETKSLHRRLPTPMLNAHCCLQAAAWFHSSNSMQSVTCCLTDEKDDRCILCLV